MISSVAAYIHIQCFFFSLKKCLHLVQSNICSLSFSLFVFFLSCLGVSLTPHGIHCSEIVELKWGKVKRRSDPFVCILEKKCNTAPLEKQWSTQRQVGGADCNARYIQQGATRPCRIAMGRAASALVMDDGNPLYPCELLPSVYLLKLELLLLQLSS